MGDTIEVSRDAFEPIAELVRLGLFKDEKEALKDLVLERAEAKVRCFDFKRRIEKRQGEEVFEEWDDFIIWDGYESARSNWSKVENRSKGKIE